jgi:hypothetical protein
MFDYSALSPDASTSVRQLAASLAANHRRSAVDLVQAGRELTDAKSLIGHGGFRAWVALELGWSPSTITRLLNASRFFSEFQNVQLEHFDATAIHLLSQSRVPKAARDTAIDQVRQGFAVTYTDACEIVGRYVPDLAPSVAVASDEEREATEQHQNWLSLEALYASAATIHLTRDYDEDEPGDPSATLACGWVGWTDDASPPQHQCRRTLGGLVQALLGREAKKLCKKCLEAKILEDYACDRSRPDGRSIYCRMCESDRQADMRKKRRKRKAESQNQ